MKPRGKWEGVVSIARFNWPFYFVASTVLAASIVGLFSFHDLTLRIVCWIAFSGTAYFLCVSLAVSHIIYDRSDLYHWHWLDRAFRGADLLQAIFCHCGFEETSTELRDRFSNVQWRLLDHFDPERMTEASIRRARAMFPPPQGTLSSPHNAWPVATASADVVFGLLAIHELRSEAERSAWFSEAKRCLRDGGRVVLVEHVRNAANFLAFGPGFLHFHSQASWRRCWSSAGFRSLDHFSITPFVQVFILNVNAP